MVYLNCRLVISLFFMDDHDDALEKINNLYQQFHILNEAMGTNSQEMNDLNISLNKQRKLIIHCDDKIKIINNKIKTLQETNFKEINDINKIINLQRKYIIYFDDVTKTIDNAIDILEETNNDLEQKYYDLRKYMIIFILFVTIFVLIIPK